MCVYASMCVLVGDFNLIRFPERKEKFQKIVNNNEELFKYYIGTKG